MSGSLPFKYFNLSVFNSSLISIKKWLELISVWQHYFCPEQQSGECNMMHWCYWRCGKHAEFIVWASHSRWQVWQLYLGVTDPQTIITCLCTFFCCCCCWGVGWVTAQNFTEVDCPYQLFFFFFPSWSSTKKKKKNISMRITGSAPNVRQTKLETENSEKVELNIFFLSSWWRPKKL